MDESIVLIVLQVKPRITSLWASLRLLYPPIKVRDATGRNDGIIVQVRDAGCTGNVGIFGLLGGQNTIALWFMGLIGCFVP